MTRYRRWLSWNLFRTIVVINCTMAYAAPLVAAQVISESEAKHHAGCAAYFFMAANAKSMTEFDRYYRAGEFAMNQATRRLGKEAALDSFKLASADINEIIQRQWQAFQLADDKYAVICADIYRSANLPN